MSEQWSSLAVQFGAGHIGRGFLGVLLSQAGYPILFVDVVESLVELINQQGHYSIRQVNPAGKQEIIVENVSAINGAAEAAVVEAVSQATLVTTAVGPSILPLIAPAIAGGLRRRADHNQKTPLNIIACENLIDNSKILQNHVLTHLPDEYQPYVETYVGFPRCVVDKIVTIPSDDEKAANPLLVIAEEGGSLIVDRDAFAGEPPAIKGMQLTDNLNAYVEQKIFTLNATHAIIAYLGYQRGYEFIHTAIHDPEIRSVALGAAAEVSQVLVQRHNFDPAEQERFLAGVLRRFENDALPDPVVRVARMPKGKLAPNDRLVRPALLALEAGVTPTNLATGIAGALLYDSPDDQEAEALSKELKEKGVVTVLSQVSNLPADSPLVALVKEKLAGIEQRK